MKFSEFKNELFEGKEYSLYLFEGEETYFHDKGLRLLKDKFLSNPELNFVCLDGTASADEIASSAFGFPFMSKKRITLIKEFYPDSKFIKGNLKDFLSASVSDGFLVVLNKDKCDSLKKYPSVCHIECGKADGYTLVKWIKAEFLNREIEIDGETAKALSEYCLSDMVRIENEINKLSSFVLDKKKVEMKDVESMVYRDSEYKIYEMTDAIGKKQFDRAITTLSEMSEKGDPPQKLLISLQNYFRRLLLISISDLSVAELSKSFGIKEFAVSKASEQAKMFKPRSLKRAYDRLLDSDFAIKNGFADADESLYLNVFKIMTEE